MLGVGPVDQKTSSAECLHLAITRRQSFLRGTSAYHPSVDGSLLARDLWTVLHAGRCCHLFGLWVRHSAMAAGHNALRRSGSGQKHAVKELHWLKWSVLIFGSTGWVHYSSVALSNLVSARFARACFMRPAIPALGNMSHAPSSPRPCARSCWPGRWRQSWSIGGPESW